VTTSGTTDFQLDFVTAVEEAFERCGLESRSGYDMRTARRSINLMMLDWANKGLNMFTYEERAEPLLYGVSEYSLGADLVDVLEQVVQLPPYGSSPQISRLNVTRVSVSTQATRTNPNITGRPVEVYYNRGVDGVTAHVWPLPDSNGPYVLIYWAMRRIQDAGAFTNTGDFPFRFLPVFVAGLAYMIAQKKRRDDPNLVQTLKAEYDEAWAAAASEDREKAVLTITPRSSSYRVGTN